MVTEPLPVSVTIEVPALKVPPDVSVNNVPDVAERSIAEALAVSTPVEPIVRSLVLTVKLEDELVSRVELMVKDANTGVATSRVIGWLAAIVTVSPVPGLPLPPLQVPVQS